MPSDITTAKVICSGGLDSNQNYLQLSDNSPGGATQLINFEPSIYGGYRRLDGYKPLHTSFNEVDPTNAEGPILTVAVYDGKFVTARKQKGSNTYRFYISDLITNWTAIGPTRSAVGVNRVRWAKYNLGVKEKIQFVDGTNNNIIFNGTTWTEPTVNQTNPSETNPGGDQLVPITSKITVFKNTIFTTGNLENPSIVNHSAPAADFNYVASAGAGQIVCPFKVVQIKPFRDELYVFGTNVIKKIVLDSNLNFVLQDVATNIGCIAADSIAEVAGDLVFLSQDGIRNISGTANIGDVNLASISKKIQAKLKIFTQSHTLSNVQTEVIQSKSQIRVFFSEAGEVQTVSQGIIGGLVLDMNGNIGWEWGETIGIRSSFCHSEYIGNQEYVLHGDYDGIIYRQELGDTFNGNPIMATYQTPYLDFGDSQVRKTIKTLNLFLRPEGDLTIYTAFKFNWGLNDSHLPTGYTFESEGSQFKYGAPTSIYGSAVYGGNSVPVAIRNVEGSFQSIQLTLNTTSTGPAFSIQGIVYEITPNGRI